MRHPAKFSEDIITIFSEEVKDYPKVLDPFAGTGRIHRLPNETVGIEIEPEWANMHPDTIVGDATNLPFPNDCFDAVATSPTFANRMADHHNAKDPSKRMTYRHTLGRPLHRDNTGRMQWGDKYRTMHELAWAECWRVTKPGGRFVFNIKDHIREGKKQEVCAWHIKTLNDLGYVMVAMIPVHARGMRYGENRDLRMLHEYVVVFDKPAKNVII